MSVTMYGASSRSNPPPYEHRTAARPTRNFSMGSTSSTSKLTTLPQRTSKPPGYSSSYSPPARYGMRKLPNGPGPLPDKFNLDKSSGENVRFARYPKTKTTSDRSTTGLSTHYRTPTSERKASNDSGYGSSSSVKYNSTSSYTLADRRAKSLSNLTTMQKDLSIKDDSPKYSSSFTKTVPSYPSRPNHSPGIASKTKTLENIPQLDANANYYLPSSRLYGSDSPNRVHSLTNHYSPSNYTSPNSSTFNKKAKGLEYSSDYRKEIITADTESLRRGSKGSTSSSSPSTVRLDIFHIIVVLYIQLM